MHNRRLHKLCGCNGIPHRPGRGGNDKCVFGGLTDHLVEMVVKACWEWPEGAAGKEEGVVRVLGGGLMWPGKA